MVPAYVGVTRKMTRTSLSALSASTARATLVPLPPCRGSEKLK